MLRCFGIGFLKIIVFALLSGFPSALLIADEIVFLGKVTLVDGTTIEVTGKRREGIKGNEEKLKNQINFTLEIQEKDKEKRIQTFDKDLDVWREIKQQKKLRKDSENRIYLAVIHLLRDNIYDFEDRKIISPINFNLQQPDKLREVLALTIDNINKTKVAEETFRARLTGKGAKVADLLAYNRAKEVYDADLEDFEEDKKHLEKILRVEKKPNADPPLKDTEHGYVPSRSNHSGDKPARRLHD